MVLAKIKKLKKGQGRTRYQVGILGHGCKNV